MRSRSSAGIFSLPGALLTLALSVVPLTILIKAARITGLVREVTRYTNSLIGLQQYLEAISNSHNASGVPLPIRIHASGLVSLTNGEKVRLSRSPALLPDGIGDALTWAEVDLGRALRVASITQMGAIITAQACYSLTNAASLPESEDSFLAITRDGIFELVETTEHFSGSTSCLSLSLAVRHSVVADPAETFYAPGTQLLIPVVRINTLYRDMSGTLRIVSHHGDSITENQPVQEQFPVIRIAQIQDEFGVSILSITAQSTSTPVPPTVLRQPLSPLAFRALTFSTALR